MDNLPSIELTMTDLHANLMARFGSVMSTEDVAVALRMSVPALRMARSRKLLAIQPLEIEGRRGQAYHSVHVARLLMSWLSKRAEEPM